MKGIKFATAAIEFVAFYIVALPAFSQTPKTSAAEFDDSQSLWRAANSLPMLTFKL